MKILFIICLLITSNVMAGDYAESRLRFSDDEYGSTMFMVEMLRGKTFSNGQFIAGGIGHVGFSEEAQTDITYSFYELEGRYNFNKDSYVTGNVKQYDNNSQTYDLGLTYDWENYTFGAFTERSMIDSHAALNNDLFATLYGVSVDNVLSKEFTATGVWYTQSINDGNNMVGKTLQLVYSPEWLPSTYVKVRAKYRDADFNPAEYFAPEEYKRYDIMFGYVKVLGEHWKLKAEVGPGTQYINNIQESGLGYRLEITGWITPSWKLSAFTASMSDAGEERYEYKWSGITLRYVW